MFTFSGKERDAETGYGYFGARYYDSDLSIWLSVDPLAGKYPSLSPYVYCANNPIKLVDPDGREIWITGDEGINYKYMDGKLYNSDGSEYTGEVTGFLQEAKNSLNTLQSKTTEGKKMIDDLQGSNNKFTIIQADKSNYKTIHTDISDATGSRYIEGTISWNPKGENVPVNTFPIMQSNEIAMMGHELSHAYDANNNVSTSGVYDEVPRKEWAAVYRENSIRRDLKQPLRTHYYSAPNSNGKLRGDKAKMVKWGKSFLPFTYPGIN